MSQRARIALPRPQPDEHSSSCNSYVARVAEVADAAGQLSSQRDAFVSLLAPLSESKAEFRYAPGKWSIKEIVGHLSDVERIFAYRLLRIGRGDETPLAGFDENPYVSAGAFDRRQLADLLNEWASARSATIALVDGMPADSWERRGIANGSPVSARAIAYILLGHLEHHRHVLEERYGLASAGE